MTRGFEAVLRYGYQQHVEVRVRDRLELAARREYENSVLPDLVAAPLKGDVPIGRDSEGSKPCRRGAVLVEDALQPRSADLQLWGTGLNDRTAKVASVELTKVQVPGARHLTKLVDVGEFMVDYE